MDIHSWLQNTADRHPPDEEDHPGFPAFLKPRRPPEPTRREQHRKSKPARGEPSSSERHHQDRRKRHEAATCSSASSDHARHLHEAAASSRSSSNAFQGHHARDTEGDETHGRSFERRARHKTRADRYEARPKKRSKGERNDEGNPKSKRRKSHQSTDIARATGMIQSFQLKNGRKDKRLTLRPDVNAGIFKHGRSSAPVATNGPGLPDLVFNEMRFLQRPTEHQDETPVDDTTKQTKKSKQQMRDEEISAYFAKKPLADTDLDQRTHHRPLTRRVEHAPDRSREQQHRVSHGADRRPLGAAIELPELPGKPFLGFGSKGPGHDSHVYHPESNVHTSTSYLPWSTSVVAERPAPQKRHDVHLFGHLDDHDLEQVGRTPKQRAPARREPGRAMKPPKTKARRPAEEHGRGNETRRATGPSRIQVYQSPTESRPTTKRKGVRLATHDSSESLPRKTIHCPADKYPPLQDTQAGMRDYRTSDVIKIRDDDDAAERSSHIDLEQQQAGEQEIRERDSAAPTSDVLRRALHAVTSVANEQPQEMTRARPPHQRETDDRQVTRNEPRHVNIYDTGYRPASQAQGSNSGNKGNAQQPTLPQRGFSRSTDNSHAWRRLPLTSISTSTVNARPRWQPLPTRGHLREKAIVQEEELLDGCSNLAHLSRHHHHEHAGGDEAEDIVHGLMAGRQPAFLGVPVEQTATTPSGSNRRGFGQPAVGEDVNALLHDDDAVHHARDRLSMHGQLYETPDMQDEREDDDMNNGFWRPNILY